MFQLKLCLLNILHNKYRLSNKITRFSYFCLPGVCYFDIEMLVVCVDIGSSVG